jgi:hypothetical protein
MNHKGPNTCSFHLKGRQDAVANTILKPYNLIDSKEEYTSYVNGYVSFKAILDSDNNVISNTDYWPEFAKEEYTRIRNRNIKL